MKINIDLIYPIGSIYMSVNEVNPFNLFGGEWEAISQGRCLMGAGEVEANNNNSNGEINKGEITLYSGATGGSVRHTHKYGLQYGGYYNNISLELNNNAGILKYDKSGNISLTGGGTDFLHTTASARSSTSRGSFEMTHYRMEGNTSYDNNLPPYLVVYMWKRVP